MYPQSVSVNWLLIGLMRFSSLLIHMVHIDALKIAISLSHTFSTHCRQDNWKDR